jgi:hypothetical protein
MRRRDVVVAVFDPGHEGEVHGFKVFVAGLAPLAGRQRLGELLTEAAV